METTFPEQQFSIFQDRAAYYAALGKWDWVLTALKAASAKNPLHLEVRRKLGRLLLQMNRTEEAEQFFRRLEKEGVLLEEAYWGQASLFLRRGRLDEAKERFWKALNRSASSIPVRYWLNWIYDRQAGTPSLAAQLEETLMNYSRLTEGGILSLAETYRSHEAWPKALPLYREILERGEDDEILLAATRIRDFLLKTGNLNEARDLLEDLQKRFPRNQKISRQLVQIYALRKEYGQAIRVLDGLLKQEDPRDPVLIVQKARLLEKWNKHGSSQDTYQQMLEPTVDKRLKEKIGALLDRLDPPLRTQVGQGMPDNPEETVFVFYEDTARRVDLAETGSFWKGLAPLVRELKTAALIQKKIYLEKEAKDRLWKNMYFQSRPFLETLKALDSDNEEVDADLMRSYRGQ
jgi:tetratricopeptide (TPR) repeat protein